MKATRRTALSMLGLPAAAIAAPARFLERELKIGFVMRQTEETR